MQTPQENYLLIHSLSWQRNLELNLVNVLLWHQAIDNLSSKTEPVGHWDVRENRHQFLVSFAEKAGFDPVLFENWKYKLPQIRAYGVKCAQCCCLPLFSRCSFF